MMIHEVSNAVAEVQGLTVSYRRKPVLWHIDLAIPQGRMVGIVGPNGAGKSTLLKAMMGILPVDGGQVRFFGRPLDAVRLKVGYIPQKDSIDWDFPASALEVVLMGRYGRLGLFQRPKKSDQSYAMHCLSEVGMADLADRQIAQLSGGQQQRILLARALAQEASVYLMDEPFVGIDAATEKSIMDLLKRMVDQEGKTVVAVHHDLLSVRKYFDWIVLLNMRVVTAGPTDQVYTADHLQGTYGQHLSILHQVDDLLRTHEVSPEEK